MGTLKLREATGSPKGHSGRRCRLESRSQGVAVNSPPPHTHPIPPGWAMYDGSRGLFVSTSQCTGRVSTQLQPPPPPPPPRSPPPFRTSQSQTQTAPNFDSFVTTVPVRLSQAVQTEDIYRCVGDTDTHTMTHTLRIHVGPDPPALSPGFRHLDTNPQDPQRGTHSIVEPRHRDARGSETHTPETDPDTYRERRAKTQTEIQTCTLHKRTETHAQTKTHSATHTPDSQPEPQTPRRPDSVSHARHSPTPSQS